MEVTKTLLSKPNLKKLTTLYRNVLKTNRKTLPFYMVGVCDQAAINDFRNARDNFSNL